MKKQISVLGERYDVIVKDKINDSGTRVGEIDWGMLEISILRGLSKKQALRTIGHEVAHAVCREGGAMFAFSDTTQHEVVAEVAGITAEILFEHVNQIVKIVNETTGKK